jgi:hypothetical protein
MKMLFAILGFLFVYQNAQAAHIRRPIMHRRYLDCADPIVKGCRYDCGFYVGAVCTPLKGNCNAQPVLSAGQAIGDALGVPGDFAAIFDNYAGMECFQRWQ